MQVKTKLNLVSTTHARPAWSTFGIQTPFFHEPSGSVLPTHMHRLGGPQDKSTEAMSAAYLANNKGALAVAKAIAAHTRAFKDQFSPQDFVSEGAWKLEPK